MKPCRARRDLSPIDAAWIYGEKPMIDTFLKDNAVYAKGTNNDPAAVKAVCDEARAKLGKKK